MARWTAEYMKSRGLEVELQEVEPGWFQAIGVIRGSGGGRSIMLNGHLDSNPIAAGWTRNPYDPWVEGNRLYGAGIRNMKSGVASMIHAADAIIKSGVKLKGDVVVACVLAELQGGLGHPACHRERLQDRRCGRHRALRRPPGLHQARWHEQVLPPRQGPTPPRRRCPRCRRHPQDDESHRGHLRYKAHPRLLGHRGSPLAQDRVHHRRPRRVLRHALRQPQRRPLYRLHRRQHRSRHDRRHPSSRFRRAR